MDFPWRKFIGNFVKMTKKAVAENRNAPVSPKQDRAENTTLIAAGVALVAGVAVTIVVMENL